MSPRAGRLWLFPKAVCPSSLSPLEQCGVAQCGQAAAQQHIPAVLRAMSRVGGKSSVAMVLACWQDVRTLTDAHGFARSVLRHAHRRGAGGTYGTATKLRFSAPRRTRDVSTEIMSPA